MDNFSPGESPSDETLCAQALSGDREAEGLLVVRYTRLVRACARPFFLAGGDSEDLIQEGMIGLLSAVRGFDAGKGVSFRTYAEVCIRNRLRSAMKSAARDKHTPLNTSVSLGDAPFDGERGPYADPQGPPRVENPEDVIIDREERHRRIEALRSKLSRLERKVLELYLEGLSCGEIASRVGKPPKSVDNAVQRIRRKAAPYITSGDLSVS